MRWIKCSCCSYHLASGCIDLHTTVCLIITSSCIHNLVYVIVDLLYIRISLHHLILLHYHQRETRSDCNDQHHFNKCYTLHSAAITSFHALSLVSASLPLTCLSGTYLE